MDWNLEEKLRHGKNPFIVGKFGDEYEIEKFLNFAHERDYRYVQSHKLHGAEIVIIVEYVG